MNKKEILSKISEIGGIAASISIPTYFILAFFELPSQFFIIVTFTIFVNIVILYININKNKYVIYSLILLLSIFCLIVFYRILEPKPLFNIPNSVNKNIVKHNKAGLSGEYYVATKNEYCNFKHHFPNIHYDSNIKLEITNNTNYYYIPLKFEIIPTILYQFEEYEEIDYPYFEINRKRFAGMENIHNQDIILRDSITTINLMSDNIMFIPNGMGDIFNLIIKEVDGLRPGIYNLKFLLYYKKINSKKIRKVENKNEYLFINTLTSEMLLKETKKSIYVFLDFNNYVDDLNFSESLIYSIYELNKSINLYISVAGLEYYLSELENLREKLNYNNCIFFVTNPNSNDTIIIDKELIIEKINPSSKDAKIVRNKYVINNYIHLYEICSEKW